MAKIYNSNSNTLVSGTSGKDTIQNGGYDKSGVYQSAGSYVTIQAGEGNDSVNSNGGDNVIIDGGKGNDYIYSANALSTVSGGAGKDSIIVEYGAKLSIDGGADDDYIEFMSGEEVASDNSTISGGKGNDIIRLDYRDRYGVDAKNVVINYASGDGNDTVFGFFADDTLHITKGSYSANASGNDVIVTVGKGKITLNNAAGKSISIKDSKGKVTTKTYGSSSSALFTEDNFVTADNLSAIVENKLTATDYKISAQNFESLSQEKLITFAEK